MSKGSKQLLLALKMALAAVIVGAVAWQFASLLRKPELHEHPFTVRWEYLIPAGFLYIACHFVWGTFWVQLLWGQGVNIGWAAGLRAYFISQLVKYVPGKAWVIVLRVALVRKYGASTAVVAVTATYETLTSMATGALLAVCLLPWSGLGMELNAYQGIALAGLALVPFAAGVLNLLARYILKRKRGPDATPLPAPSFWLLLRGMLQDTVGWIFLGVSLWLTVAGISTEAPAWHLETFLEDLSAITISYVAGFAAFIMPGGFGAREYVLQLVLSRQLKPFEGNASPAVAAIIALVLRLVWTSFEVVVSFGAWLTNRPQVLAGRASDGQLSVS